MDNPQQDEKDWRPKLHDVIYESKTVAGRVFDVVLLVCILASILVVMLDSVATYHQRWGNVFNTLEWVFTGIFSVEYIMRLISIRKPWRYVLSLPGMIDLVAILPSYLSVFYPGARSFLVLRGLRLLRIFRIFKLTHFLSEMQFLGVAIRNSAYKISIFTLFVVTLVIILGSLMYLVEKGQNGFSSIPDSIYWAIVTITTVGYGDISPVTPVGKFVASIIMLMGYGIIAVPTGIVTTEMAQAVRKQQQNSEVCPNCGREGHDSEARFCKFCGARL